MRIVSLIALTMLILTPAKGIEPGKLYSIMDNIADPKITDQSIKASLDKLSQEDLQAIYAQDDKRFHNMTLLMVAAKYNKPSIVEYLLAKGTNPNQTEKFGDTPKTALFFAIDNINNTNQKEAALNSIDLLIAYGGGSSNVASSPIRWANSRIKDTQTKNLVMRKLLFSDIFDLVKAGQSAQKIEDAFNSSIGKSVDLASDKNTFFSFNIGTQSQPTIKQVNLLTFTIYQLIQHVDDSSLFANTRNILAWLFADPQIKVNATNKSGESPLITVLLAIEANQTSQIRIALLSLLQDLIDHGADTTISYQEQSIQSWVQGHIQPDSVKNKILQIINERKILASINQSILRNEDPNKIKAAIDTLPDDQINAIDSSQKTTMLMTAAFAGNAIIARYLLEVKKADSEITVLVPEDNNKPNSALYFALTGFKSNPSRVTDYSTVINLLMAFAKDPFASIDMYQPLVKQLLTDASAQAAALDVFGFFNIITILATNPTSILNAKMINPHAQNISLIYNSAQAGQPVVLDNDTPLIIGLKMFANALETSNTTRSTSLKNALIALLGKDFKISADTPNNSGRLPIIYALEHNSVFTLILAKMSPDAIKTNNADGQNHSILHAIVIQSPASNVLLQNITSLLANDVFKNKAIGQQYVNGATTDGKTALIILLERLNQFLPANQSALIESLKGLKAAGADPSIEDSQGQSAADLARNISDTDLQSKVLSALGISKGSEIIDHLVTALKNNDTATINTIIGTQITPSNINHFSSGGLTALMAAALNGNADALAQLIAKPGINLDLINPVDFSALKLAIFYYGNNKDKPNAVIATQTIIETLIQQGATPTLSSLCDAIETADGTFKGSLPNILALLVQTQLVKYMLSQDATKFNALLTKYKTLQLTASLSINIAKPGETPIIIMGNLLKILLALINQTTGTNNSTGSLQTEFDALVAALPALLSTKDSASGRLMASFGTFNYAIFSSLLAKTPKDILGTLDNDQNTLLANIVETSPSLWIENNVTALLNAIDPAQKTSWINKTNMAGQTALQKLIARTKEFSQEPISNQDHYVATLTLLKKSGVTVDQLTTALVRSMPTSAFKQNIMKALDISDQPVGPAIIINQLESLNSTLNSVKSLLKK